MNEDGPLATGVRDADGMRDSGGCAVLLTVIGVRVPAVSACAARGRNPAAGHRTPALARPR